MFHLPGIALDRPRLRRVASLTVLAAFLLAGCSAILEDQPVATPVPFPEISGFLAQHGIVVSNYTSGDAGCVDRNLIPTAIAFDAAGLDALQPLRLRIYIFRDHDTWQRRRPDVDACAALWATDPATFEFVDASPYVVASQGPWPPQFKAALRAAITEAAGNGG
jgi:hypothetical protein